MDLGTGIRLALEEFSHHKLRTLLTMLGMIFGVGAVIAMLSVGEGAEREALRLIESWGLRNVIVRARTFDEDRLAEIRETSLGLTLHDVDAAVDTLPYVTEHAAVRHINVYALFSRHGRAEAEVVGVSPEHFAMAHLDIASGRPLLPIDDELTAQVCVLGGRVARVLFPGVEPLGSRIKVNHVWLTVVGVLEGRDTAATEFEGVPLAAEENRIYLPIRTAMRKFRRKPLEDEIDEVHLAIAPTVPIGDAVAAIDRLLEVRHRGADDYLLVVPEKLLEQNRATRRIFNVVMACIAGISLLVGGIGIMNIMLANVLERTWEIGIRRAVGARRRDIRNQFIIEAFTIAILGGLAGVALGFGLAQTISIWSGWAVAWSAFAVVLAVGVCAGVGLVSGIYPAVSAARLDPIEALRRD